MLLIDEDGRPVDEPDVIGQIPASRSAALFHGYWNDPEATTTTLVPDPRSTRPPGRSVFHTGDLAYRGAGGEPTSPAGPTSLVKVLTTGSTRREVERQGPESRASAAPPR